MRDATGHLRLRGRAAAVESQKSRDGIVGWLLLYAATMATVMALIGGANLIGDRFDARPAAWSIQE